MPVQKLTPDVWNSINALNTKIKKAQTNQLMFQADPALQGVNNVDQDLDDDEFQSSILADQSAKFITELRTATSGSPNAAAINTSIDAIQTGLNTAMENFHQCLTQGLSPFPDMEAQFNALEASLQTIETQANVAPGTFTNKINTLRSSGLTKEIDRLSRALDNKQNLAQGIKSNVAVKNHLGKTNRTFWQKMGTFSVPVPDWQRVPGSENLPGFKDPEHEARVNPQPKVGPLGGLVAANPGPQRGYGIYQRGNVRIEYKKGGSIKASWIGDTSKTRKFFEDLSGMSKTSSDDVGFNLGLALVALLMTVFGAMKYAYNLREEWNSQPKDHDKLRDEELAFFATHVAPGLEAENKSLEWPPLTFNDQLSRDQNFKRLVKEFELIKTLANGKPPIHLDFNLDPGMLEEIKKFRKDGKFPELDKLIDDVSVFNADMASKRAAAATVLANQNPQPVLQGQVASANAAVTEGVNALAIATTPEALAQAQDQLLLQQSNVAQANVNLQTLNVSQADAGSLVAAQGALTTANQALVDIHKVIDDSVKAQTALTVAEAKDPQDQQEIATAKENVTKTNLAKAVAVVKITSDALVAAQAANVPPAVVNERFQQAVNVAKTQELAAHDALVANTQTRVNEAKGAVQTAFANADPVAQAKSLNDLAKARAARSEAKLAHKRVILANSNPAGQVAAQANVDKANRRNTIATQEVDATNQKHDAIIKLGPAETALATIMAANPTFADPAVANASVEYTSANYDVTQAKLAVADADVKQAKVEVEKAKDQVLRANPNATPANIDADGGVIAARQLLNNLETARDRASLEDAQALLNREIVAFRAQPRSLTSIKDQEAISKINEARINLATINLAQAEEVKQNPPLGSDPIALQAAVDNAQSELLEQKISLAGTKVEISRLEFKAANDNETKANALPNLPGNNLVKVEAYKARVKTHEGMLSANVVDREAKLEQMKHNFIIAQNSIPVDVDKLAVAQQNLMAAVVDLKNIKSAQAHLFDSINTIPPTDLKPATLSNEAKAIAGEKDVRAQEHKEAKDLQARLNTAPAALEAATLAVGKEKKEVNNAAGNNDLMAYLVAQEKLAKAQESLAKAELESASITLDALTMAGLPPTAAQVAAKNQATTNRQDATRDKVSAQANILTANASLNKIAKLDREITSLNIDLTNAIKNEENEKKSVPFDLTNWIQAQVSVAETQAKIDAKNLEKADEKLKGAELTGNGVWKTNAESTKQAAQDVSNQSNQLLTEAKDKQAQANNLIQRTDQLSMDIRTTEATLRQKETDKNEEKHQTPINMANHDVAITAEKLKVAEKNLALANLMKDQATMAGIDPTQAKADIEAAKNAVDATSSQHANAKNAMDAAQQAAQVVHANFVKDLKAIHDLDKLNVKPEGSPKEDINAIIQEQKGESKEEHLGRLVGFLDRTPDAITAENNEPMKALTGLINDEIQGLDNANPLKENLEAQLKLVEAKQLEARNLQGIAAEGVKPSV